MNNAEYRKHEGISKSQLFKISISPLHFKWAMEHPEENESPALLFGRAVHKYILEPDDFDNEVAVAPVVDRRTKEGKEIYNAFIESSKGKDVISESDFEVIKEMAAVIKNDRFANRILQGQHEQSFFWTDEETQEVCKCRPDCLAQIKDRKIIVDYKTTDNAETSAFMKSAIKYGYDLQAGMYSEGMEKNTGDKYMFVFVAQEKKPPYAINIVEANEDFMTEGRQLFHELLRIYHDCKVNDNWYGYMPDGINSLGLPEWLRRDVQSESNTD